MSHGGNPEALSARLQRVEGLAASLYLFPRLDSLSETMAVVQRHLHHIRVLVIESLQPNGYLPRDGPALVLHHLRSPAPLLEKVELALVRNSDDSDDDSDNDSLDSGSSQSDSNRRNVDLVPEDLFSCNAPRLTHVFLGRDIGLPPSCAAFRTVTILGVEFFHISDACIRSIDSNFPALEHLYIGAQDCDDLNSAETSLGLKSLCATEVDDDPLGILRVFRYSEVPTVYTSFYENWSIDFSADGGDGGYTVFAGSSVWKTTWVVSDTASRSLAVHGCPRLSVPDPALWDNITSLTLSDGFFPLPEQLPELRRVTRLAVDLFQVEKLDVGARDLCVKPGIFRPPPATLSPIVCPRLRMLEIGVDAAQADAESPYARFLLAPQDLYEFMHFHLRFDSAKLDELVLRRVDLLSNVDQFYQQVLGMVDSLRRDSTPLPDPYAQRSTWHIPRPE